MELLGDSEPPRGPSQLVAALCPAGQRALKSSGSCAVGLDTGNLCRDSSVASQARSWGPDCPNAVALTLILGLKFPLPCLPLQAMTLTGEVLSPDRLS